MKTTLEVPGDLMRAVEIRAAEENCELHDTVAELLRRGLAAPRGDVVRNRVAVPLIPGGRPAAAGEEITPEKAAELLTQEEDARVLGR